MTKEDDGSGHGQNGNGHGENPGKGGENGHPHRVTIIVNGKEKPWTKEKISYDDLVTLSGEPMPTGPDPGFTITYFNGPNDRPEGTVTKGHSVKVKDGMVFNVTPTNRS